MYTYNKGIPTLQEANRLLKEAEKMAPGLWVDHSVWVGQAASLIAKHDKELDAEKALILGLLHDIGRRFDRKGMLHALDGYNFSISLGYSELARVCLTHSFQTRELASVSGWEGFSDTELDFVSQYINNIEYDIYDKLIQLSDFLVSTKGFCMLEARLVDVAMRHGINGHILSKWKACYSLKDYFSTRIGGDLYSILPGIAENTMEMSTRIGKNI